jgi:hypothetical protein
MMYIRLSSPSVSTHLEFVLALVVCELDWLPVLGLSGLLLGGSLVQGVGADGLVDLTGEGGRGRGGGRKYFCQGM